MLSLDGVKIVSPSDLEPGRLVLCSDGESDFRAGLSFRTDSDSTVFFLERGIKVESVIGSHILDLGKPSMRLNPQSRAASLEVIRDGALILRSGGHGIVQRHRLFHGQHTIFGFDGKTNKEDQELGSPIFLNWEIGRMRGDAFETVVRLDLDDSGGAVSGSYSL